MYMDVPIDTGLHGAIVLISTFRIVFSQFYKCSHGAIAQVCCSDGLPARHEMNSLVVSPVCTSRPLSCSESFLSGA